MKKLLQIFLGWWFWVTNRNNKLARYRLSQCVSCNLFKSGMCTYCGCPVQAKSRLPEETCPHPDGSKWETKFPVTVYVDGKEAFKTSFDIVSGEYDL